PPVVDVGRRLAARLTGARFSAALTGADRRCPLRTGREALRAAVICPHALRIAGRPPRIDNRAGPAVGAWKGSATWPEPRSPISSSRYWYRPECLASTGWSGTA